MLNISTPSQELDLVKRLLAHAQTVCNVPNPITPYPVQDYASPLAIGWIGEPTLSLIYESGITQEFSVGFEPDELEAIIAHELAHVHYGDVDLTPDQRRALPKPERKRRELRADVFAASHGYGAASIRAFNRFAQFAGHDANHPSDAARIAAIEREMSKLAHKAGYAYA